MTAPVDPSALREAAEAALEGTTPEPWRYVRAGKFRKGSTDHGIGSLHGPDVLIYSTPCEHGLLMQTYERQARDGEFMAFARSAVPVLLSQLEAMRAALADAKRTWTFGEWEQHTHTWHDREGWIERHPILRGIDHE